MNYFNIQALIKVVRSFKIAHNSHEMQIKVDNKKKKKKKKTFILI